MDKENNNKQKQLIQYEKDIIKAEKRLSEISLIIKRVYEDRVMEKLTEEQYFEMSKEYEAESADSKALIHEAQKAISSYKDADINSRQFATLIQKYFDLKELDTPILNKLVHKIEIYERKIVDGKRKQKIDIYYNFVGIISQGVKGGKHENISIWVHRSKSNRRPSVDGRQLAILICWLNHIVEVKYH